MRIYHRISRASKQFLRFSIGSTALFITLGGTQQIAFAETFSIDGISLNTNERYRRIDRQPRMSVYQTTAGDRDQQFDRIPGQNGAVLLKHRSTGKCINIHYLKSGSEFNVWPCNPSDPDQNLNIINLDNNTVQLQRAGTNLCIDTPTRSNSGKVHVWTCDPNNPNQRWSSSDASTPQPTQAWELPWPAGVTATLSTSRRPAWHNDGWGRPSLDIALPAGTAVLSPTDAKVVKFCQVGRDGHTAILLEASDGQKFSLIHVKTSGLQEGRRFKQGEQIGVIAADEPRNNRCAVSYGVHLHFGLPSQTFSIGNYQLTPNIKPGTKLKSTNR